MILDLLLGPGRISKRSRSSPSMAYLTRVVTSIGFTPMSFMLMPSLNNGVAVIGGASSNTAMFVFFNWIRSDCVKECIAALVAQ